MEIDQQLMQAVVTYLNEICRAEGDSGMSFIDPDKAAALLLELNKVVPSSENGGLEFAKAADKLMTRENLVAYLQHHHPEKQHLAGYDYKIEGVNKPAMMVYSIDYASGGHFTMFGKQAFVAFCIYRALRQRWDASKELSAIFVDFRLTGIRLNLKTLDFEAHAVVVVPLPIQHAILSLSVDD